MDVTPFQAFVLQATDWVVKAVPNLVAAILLLIAGYLIAGWVSKLVARLMGTRPHIDQTLTPVIATILRSGILIVTFVAVLGQMGVQTASVLAVLGAAGLAIGLALQGTLSNIAAGMMLLWLRPFKVGDYIDTGSVAGTVKELGLFASELHSWDGVYLFVPNAQLWNTRVINYSRLPTRMVELKFGVGYDDDLGLAERTLREIVEAHAQVLEEPATQVEVVALADSSVNFVVRPWCRTEDYWRVYFDLQRSLKEGLEAAGCSIPFPQRDVHVHETAA
jgi:small conductance mechanosensitive channel